MKLLWHIDSVEANYYASDCQSYMHPTESYWLIHAAWYNTNMQGDNVAPGGFAAVNNSSIYA